MRVFFWRWVYFKEKMWPKYLLYKEQMWPKWTCLSASALVCMVEQAGQTTRRDGSISTWQGRRAHDVDEEHVKSALVRAKNAVRWIFIPRIHAALITMTTNQRVRSPCPPYVRSRLDRLFLLPPHACCCSGFSSPGNWNPGKASSIIICNYKKNKKWLNQNIFVDKYLRIRQHA